MQAYLAYLMNTNQFPAPFSQSPTITDNWMLLRIHFIIEKKNKTESKLIFQGHQKGQWQRCQWSQCLAASLKYKCYSVYYRFNLILSWDHEIFGQEKNSLIFPALDLLL